MKNLKLLSLLLSLILLTLLFSCDKVELDEITKEDPQKVQKIDLNSDANLKQLVSNLKGSNSNLRAVNSNWDNLDTENIVGYMKENGLYNYSIPIKSADENFIEYLKIANRGEQYFGYILQYAPSNAEYVKGFDNYTGLVRMYDLNGQLLSTEYIQEGIQQENIPDSLVANQRMTEVENCRYVMIDVVYDDNSIGPGGTTTEMVILCDPVAGGGNGGDDGGTSSGGDWGTPIDGAPIPTGGDGGISGGSSTGGNGLGDPFGFTDSPTTEEEITTYLNYYLQNNQDAIIDLPCEQIQQWSNVSSFKPGNTVMQKIESLADQYAGVEALFRGNFSIQNIENASGKTVNMDYFSVDVTLPAGMTPQNLLSHIRQNINDFIDTDLSEFTPFNLSDEGQDIGYNIQEDDLWNSNTPKGTVIHIEIPGAAGDGSVICSYSNSHRWRFTTISAPLDWTHPVSGTREFGYKDNYDGTYTFYTRGVDRINNWIDSQFVERFKENPFEDPDKLWQSFQNGIKNYVVGQGGSADFDNTGNNKNKITGRPDWNQISDVLQGNLPVESLDHCN
ncbi:hypothetical protein QYS48_28355 [Marivirga arenosa]|uniref:Uncharacterized protein n=1 Tax=Marivirga arenosa TaxID=3059076 RepID=A0AA51N7T7_9BACT|nr:hypothetical protein [Marivirga sp. ABR2-2]WMN07270.1 hypothetical protein QYS48_28355 [Marivirga sp. ABR2-2]